MKVRRAARDHHQLSSRHLFCQTLRTAAFMTRYLVHQHLRFLLELSSLFQIPNTSTIHFFSFLHYQQSISLPSRPSDFLLTSQQPNHRLLTTLAILHLDKQSDTIATGCHGEK